jgi:hypothetical protein
MNEEYKNKTVSEIRKLRINLPEVRIDAKVIENLKLSFQKYEEQLKNAFKSFQDTLDLIRTRNPIFVEEDWYLSEEFWLKFSFSEIYNITPSQLEQLLFKEFEKEKNNIRDKIISKHKERSSIFEELFESYNRKHYYSVVLLSYSLIDGISKKNFGINFWGFNKDLKMSYSSEIISLVEPDSLFNFIENRLKNRGEIAKQNKDIPGNEKSFSNNRHCVIHGDSYLFGNKTNAVKSILMIDFISSLKSKKG